MQSVFILRKLQRARVAEQIYFFYLARVVNLFIP
jgi:hypothetical protein